MSHSWPREVYLPPYHGRVKVSIGEELPNGSLVPPRPSVAQRRGRDAQRHGGGRSPPHRRRHRLGSVVGYRNVVVNVPSDKKSVLPRHLAVLGTTRAGKSTTVARLIQQAQVAGMAVILLDVEGEYTHLHEPTDDDKMLTARRERGLSATGVPAAATTLYHLVGRDTTNPRHPQRRPFSLQFAACRLTPSWRSST